MATMLDHLPPFEEWDIHTVEHHGTADGWAEWVVRFRHRRHATTIDVAARDVDYHALLERVTLTEE